MSRVLPILFNGEMIRAILDGRKTVTRRLIKLKRKDSVGFYVLFREQDDSFYGVDEYDEDDNESRQTLPYQPGDILYVRETWAWEPCYDCGMDTEDHNCCDESAHRIYNHKKNEYGCYMYKASVEDNVYPSVDTWHPSIHMPKEATRIWLKVTDVRAERLQDITEQQAEAEGLYKGWSPTPKAAPALTARQAFMWLWDTTVKRDDDKWLFNPWVYVVSFERCKKPEPC